MTNHKEPADNPARALLAKKEAGVGPHPLRPLDHIAFAIAIEMGNEVKDSLEAVQCIRKEFVDWNEARVARTQELARAVDGLNEAEQVAMRIKEEYNAFFEKKGALDFDFLAGGKPAETRRLLGQQLPHLGKGAVSLLLFEFCAGSPLPLSDEALKQARKDGIIGKSGERGQLTRTLTESLEPSEIATLVQYWELEAHDRPYCEMPKRDAKGKKQKKQKK